MRPVFPEGMRPFNVFASQLNPSLSLSTDYRQAFAVTEEARVSQPPPVESMVTSSSSLDKTLETLVTTPFTATTSSTPTPESLESRIEKQYTEVQSLLKKVEDLNKTLLENTRSITNLQSSQVTFTTEISGGLSNVVGTEDLVSKKLNELIIACNGISLALKEAFSLNTKEVQSTVSTQLTSFVEKLKLDVQSVEKEVTKLVAKPSLEASGLASELSQKVLTDMKDAILKDVKESIKTTMTEEFKVLIKSVVSEITQSTSKQVDQAVTNVSEKIGSLEKMVIDQSHQLSEVKESLKKTPTSSAPPTGALTLSEVKLLNDLKTGQELNATTLHRLKSMFNLLTKGITESLATQSWEPLKTIQAQVDATSKIVSEVSKGEKLSGLSNILASTQEVIEATRPKASGSAISEGEVAKVDKGKGVATNEPKKKGSTGIIDDTSGVDETGNPILAPDATETKLMYLQRVVGAQTVAMKKERLAAKEQMMQLGTLDHSNAALLGISLERYNKIKSDPRIIKALNEAEDLDMMRNYTEKNQQLDHLSFNLPIADLVKRRFDLVAQKKRQIEEEVKRVEKEKSKPLVKPRTTVTRKAQRDADLSKFQPMAQVPDTAVQMELYKQQYEYFMGHRDDKAKIIDVEITGEDQLKLFTMVITREGGTPKEFSKVSVHKFGFTELREMVPILKAKPKNTHIQSWLMKTQQKMISKRDLEVKLGLPSPQSPQSPVKRKATDDASVSRPLKK